MIRGNEWQLEGCIYVVSSNLLFHVSDIIVLGLVSLEGRKEGSMCLLACVWHSWEVKEECRLLSQVSI